MVLQKPNTSSLWDTDITGTLAEGGPVLSTRPKRICTHISLYGEKGFEMQLGLCSRILADRTTRNALLFVIIGKRADVLNGDNKIRLLQKQCQRRHKETERSLFEISGAASCVGGV